MYDVNLQNLKVAILEKNIFYVKEILNFMEPEDLNKEILKLAILSKDPQIITAVSDKTLTKHFDQEIVNLSIDTKSMKLAEPILRKANSEQFHKNTLLKVLDPQYRELTAFVTKRTDPRFFDRGILEKSLDTRDPLIVRSVVGKTNPIHFDKSILLKTLSFNQTAISSMIIQKTDAKYFDQNILQTVIDQKASHVVKDVVSKTPKNLFTKEILKKAIHSHSGSIVHAVAQKTDASCFDDQILKQSIQTKEESIVRTILQKVDPKLINKEILKLGIETNVGKIVYAIGKYSKKEIFDQEILEKALAKKSPEIVRAVVDYTTDKKLFSDYKLQIQKAILKEGDIRNLTAQILSRQDNESFDREMQELVVDMYLDVINDHFKKSSIPKEFPMREFEASIKDSRYFFSNPAAINFDSLNKENKFLLIPVFSYGHAFSAVVRKQNEDQYSVTFVNLGARPFERDRSGNQYKEFVYNKKDALQVLKDHSYSIRLFYPQRAVDTRKAYQNFAKNAKEEYLLHITSRDQKVGNCFLKNIEKGIRYALALGLSKTENKNFDPNTLRVGVEGGGKYRVKFLKPIHKPHEKTNDLETVALRKDLIDALLKRFPEYEKSIMQEWNIYKTRKERDKHTVIHEIPDERVRKNIFSNHQVFSKNPFMQKKDSLPNQKQRDLSFYNKLHQFANKENRPNNRSNEMVYGR